MSDFIKTLETSDSEIELDDYFLEVGENRFIYQLVEDYDDYSDYALQNGIEVIVLRKSDFDYNSKDANYRKIVTFL